MCHKRLNPQPIRGFEAQTTAAKVIETASRLDFPLSPLSIAHVIASAILGAGASRRANAVKSNVVGSLVTAWVLTISTCMLLAWRIFSVIHLLISSAVK